MPQFICGHLSNLCHPYALNLTSKNVQNGISSTRKGLHGLQNGISSAKQALHDLQNGISSAKQALHGLQNGISSAKQALHDLQNGISSAKQALHGLQNEISSAKPHFARFGSYFPACREGVKTACHPPILKPQALYNT